MVHHLRSSPLLFCSNFNDVNSLLTLSVSKNPSFSLNAFAGVEYFSNAALPLPCEASYDSYSFSAILPSSGWEGRDPPGLGSRLRSPGRGRSIRGGISIIASRYLSEVWELAGFRDEQCPPKGSNGLTSMFCPADIALTISPLALLWSCRRRDLWKKDETTSKGHSGGTSASTCQSTYMPVAGVCGEISPPGHQGVRSEHSRALLFVWQYWLYTYQRLFHLCTRGHLPIAHVHSQELHD